jgi:hypothetical protein
LADMKTGDMERMKEFGFKISAKDIEKAGGGATGALKLMLNDVAKTFDGGADKLSKTSLGMWSTITGTFKTGVAHMGTDTLKLLNPELERMANYLSNGGADKLFAAGSRAMARATDGLILGVDKAEKYVKANFLDNPQFTSLDMKGKVDFIFTDIKKAFDGWYNAGGNEQIANTTGSLIKYIGDALSASSDKIGSIGADLGLSLGKGMVTGFDAFIKENPKMSVLMAALMTPGGLPFKLTAAGAVAVTAIDTPAVQKAIATENNPAIQQSTYEKLSSEGSYIQLAPKYIGDRLSDIAKVPVNWVSDMFSGAPSHSGGLDRVPYDGYRAVLHRDETVLTKSEADDRRSGGRSGGGVNVSVTGNTFHVRQESDIDDIAWQLARNLMSLQGATAQ